jgi:diguanylate cyclase (GGDEF)-like protein
MPGPELLLAGIAVVTVIAIGLLIGPAYVWIRTNVFGRAVEEEQPAASDGVMELRPAPAGATNGALARRDEPPEVDRAAGAPSPTDPGTQDRMIRVVSWAFLMAVAVIAAASGVWAASLPAIVILVAITGEGMVVLHDILPATRLRTLRGPLQAILAIGFASSLVALTGGLESPFTFTFPLIVGAGALLAAPRAAVILTLVAAGSYLVAGLIGSPNPGTGPVVQLLVNLTGIFLLAFVGASVGREQRRARDAAIRLSSVDSLTGLFNRSFFFTGLERELARGDRSGRAFCLVMLDLDDLKTINDRSGHHAGDQVLRGVADIIRSRIRKIDVAARYGGDEFVILLPETDPTGGWVFAEKIRQMVAEQGTPGLEPSPTISTGVVSYPADGRTADALVISADRAMYTSKRAGKNRVARANGVPANVPATVPVDVPVEAEDYAAARAGKPPA